MSAEQTTDGAVGPMIYETVKNTIDRFDTEMLAAIGRYAGPNFAYARTVGVDVSSFGGEGEWTVAEFTEMLNKAVASVPPGCRDKIKIFCEHDYDYGSKFEMTYIRLETEAEVMDRIERALLAFAASAEQERRTYEALKRKFG